MSKSEKASYDTKAAFLSENEEWEELLKLALERVGVVATDADGWRDLGRAALHLEKYPQATNAFKEQVRLQPSFDSWYEMSHCYFNQSKFRFAHDAIKEGLAFEPRNVEGILLFSGICEQRGGFTLAHTLAELTTELAPKNAETWFRLGVSSASLENYSEAQEHFYQCMKLDPEHALAPYWLGLTFAIMDEVGSALKYWKRINFGDKELSMMLKHPLFNMRSHFPERSKLDPDFKTAV